MGEPACPRSDGSFLPLSSAADRITAASLISAWIAMIILVDPSGEFPLNDDWIYAGVVKSILAGGLRFEQPANANFMAQAYWGALFCLPFGFSFVALRISTLVLGAAGIVGLYGWARLLSAPRIVALAMAFSLMANPIYLGLSNTFMTDVPFVSLIILSLYSQSAYLLGHGRRYGVISFALACASMAIRQYELLILFSLSLASAFRLWPRKAAALLAFAPVLIALRLQQIYTAWQQSLGGQPAAVNDSILKAYQLGMSNLVSLRTLMIACAIILYLGIFLLPLILLIFDQQRHSRRANANGLAVLILAVFSMASSALLDRLRLPLFGNIIAYFGIGPLTLHDTYIAGVNNPVYSPGIEFFWKIITFLAIMGVLLAAMITTRSLAATPSDAGGRSKSPPTSDRSMLITLIAATFGYLLTITIGGVGGALFDRYLLPLCPLIMMLLWLLARDGIRISGHSAGLSLSGLLILAMTTLSIASCHDYLAWNRTRWQALRDLLNRDRISATNIDGGYEFNGMFTAARDYVQQPGKSWWWVRGDDYVVASGPLTGYKVIKVYPFQRWLPLPESQLVVLQKLSPSAGRSLPAPSAPAGP